MGSRPSPSDKIVLVSGINGYIASHIGLDLLKKGYRVRGTARKAESTTSLVNDVYKEYADRFEALSVPDMTVNGAFDEAVQGVTSIIHTASPISFSLQTLDDFMIPAIGGAVGILDSAMKHAGPQLESFVITSSIAAVTNLDQPKDHSFTEADWNEYVLRAVKEPGAPPMLFYSASKTAAEKAVWGWRDRNQPSFSISAINPGVVIGPPINPPSSPSSLNVSILAIWKLLSGAKTVPPGIGSQSYIDVRDTAAIHVYAVTHAQEANGHRYLCAAGRGTTQAAADILRTAYPEKGVVEGEPGSDYEADYSFPKDGNKFYSTRMEEALGGKLIGYEQSVLETAKVLERYL